MLLSEAMYNYIITSYKTQEPMSDKEMDFVLNNLDGYWLDMAEFEQKYVELWICKNLV